MDWNAAIEKNREALKHVLAMLVGLMELGCVVISPLRGGRYEASGGGRASSDPPARRPDGGRPPINGKAVLGRPVLPRHLHRAILRLLRPAEAAARRLVIVAARGLVVTVRPRHGTGLIRTTAHNDRNGARSAGFPLFDPLSRSYPRRPAARCTPRIWAQGMGDPFPAPLRTLPSDLDEIDATRVALRLAALAGVLDDLPRQAHRFARWKARLHARRRPDGSTAKPVRIWPLRPGRPPGWRGRHEIHDILDVTHGLACWALERPDTS